MHPVFYLGKTGPLLENRLYAYRILITNTNNKLLGQHMDKVLCYIFFGNRKWNMVYLLIRMHEVDLPYLELKTIN